MENMPRNLNLETSFFPYESPTVRARREREQRITKERIRLGFIMAMAHGAVELTLRRQPPRIRQAVRNDLTQRYGLKSPQYWF